MRPVASDEDRAALVPGRGPGQRLAGVLLWVAPALLASNYVIARAAHDVVAPYTLAFGRWAVALVLMLPWLRIDRAALVASVRAEWPRLVALGALGMWMCGAFVYEGGRTTTATNIGLIYAAAPVGIALGGRWLLHEPTSTGQRIGLAVALAGVVFVIARGDPATLLQSRFAVGDLWIVAAAVSWVGYSVLQQYWPSRLGTRERLACITAGGLLVLLPFTVLERLATPVPAWSGPAVLLIVLAGVVPGFLSYQAYAVLLREFGSTRAGVVMYLGPLYAAAFSWWILGERLHWYHAVGALLILPSIRIATAGSTRADPTRSAGEEPEFAWERTDKAATLRTPAGR